MFSIEDRFEAVVCVVLASWTRDVDLDRVQWPLAVDAARAAVSQEFGGGLDDAEVVSAALAVLRARFFGPGFSGWRDIA